MAKALDKKILLGFLREVSQYVPLIHEGLERFRRDVHQRQALTEALRYIHTIKGASAMAGLAALSHMAYYIEEILAEVGSGQRPLDATYTNWLHHTVDQLEPYLAALLSGDGREQAIMTAVEQSFQHLQGLPTAAVAFPVAERFDAQRHTAVGVEDAEEALDRGQSSIEAGDDTLFVSPIEATAGETDFPIELLSETVDDTEDAGEDASPTPGASGTAVEALPDGAEISADTPGPLDALIATIDREVYQAYGTGARPAPHQAPPERPGPTERYILFTLAGGRYAIPILHVLEVDRVPPITPVPNVPLWLSGVTNLRGDILSVIDLRTFLGLGEAHALEGRRLLVVQTMGEEITTSLIVDQIQGIIQLSAARLDMPVVRSADTIAPYLRGMYEHADQALAVLDLERFLRSNAIGQFDDR